VSRALSGALRRPVEAQKGGSDRREPGGAGARESPLGISFKDHGIREFEPGLASDDGSHYLRVEFDRHDTENVHPFGLVRRFWIKGDT
jgi:hypothetical protein